MGRHTISDLYQMQSMPLDIKVRMTQNRIKGWIEEFGEDGVYISFSGGKDSTVLVDMVTKMGYTDVPLVFIDTGLEYPEIRNFVKTYGDRVTWVKPKKNFKQVINDYGYPFISKEVSECVYGAKKYLEALANSVERVISHTPTSTESSWDWESIPKLLAEKGMGSGGSIQRLALMCGTLTKNGQIAVNIPKQDRSGFSQERYKFLLDAPFYVSNKCCNVMKKSPAHSYQKKTGRVPMTAQMASESRLRLQKWLQNGCNAFDAKQPISNPMSFWTDQDVYSYIVKYELPICSVYGDIVPVEDKETIIHDKDILELFDMDRTFYKTTKCDRTGCMFCGFGCHLEKEGESRFKRMKETHPSIYDYIMRPTEEGGLNYKEVIDWINEHGGFNIEY